MITEIPTGGFTTETFKRLSFYFKNGDSFTANLYEGDSLIEDIDASGAHVLRLTMAHGKDTAVIYVNDLAYRRSLEITRKVRVSVQVDDTPLPQTGVPPSTSPDA